MIDRIEAGVNPQSIPWMHDIPARQEIAMLLELESPRIPLAAQGLASLADADSARIVCEAGTVWITIDNDSRDIVLAPGQSFLVDRRARVLIHALEEACVRIVERATPVVSPFAPAVSEVRCTPAATGLAFAPVAAEVA